jgi:hypothetical protein
MFLLGQNTSVRSGVRGGIVAKLLIVFVVVFAVVALAWMLFLPAIVTGTLQRRTGFPVKVESLAVNPFTAKVQLRGLLIENPAGFPVPDFVQLREFHAEAELTTLFSDRLVFDVAVLDVAQVALVKNPAGQSNAALFQERLTGVARPAPGRPGPAEPAKKSQEFLIRHLMLRFDKVLIVDATGGKPNTREYRLGVNQTYENVTSPVQIALPLVTKISALGGSLGDFAGKLGVDTLDAAKKTGGTLLDAGKKAGETLKGLFQSLEQNPKK